MPAKRGRPRKTEEKPAKKLLPARSNGKHPGGRPRKYNPEICETLPDMFKDGQSIVEVCAALDISIVTFLEWERQYPEFLNASTRGRLLSRAWWEKMGRDNLFDVSTYGEGGGENKRFNDRLWSKNMGCRYKKAEPGVFDWTDKQEVTLDATMEIKHTVDPEGV